MNSKTVLLHVVRAGIATSRLTCLLNSWQQQANKNTNNCDHNQQFYESKRTSFVVLRKCNLSMRTLSEMKKRHNLAPTLEKI